MVRTVFCVVLFCGVLFGRKVQGFPIENEIDTDDDMPDLSHLGEGIFRDPSRESGKRVASWNNASEVNPEELGLYAEGDIVVSKKGRTATRDRARRWPKGEIPYEINGSFNSHALDMIQRAMNLFHKHTCITFRNRTSSDQDYVSIENAKAGCWSRVGRDGGMQKLNLQTPACMTRIGTPLHELMHAAGFLHEHNRYDRDGFVTIAFPNVMKGLEPNFNKANKVDTRTYAIKYDFRSVMHYSESVFSSNGQPTIIPKDASKAARMGKHNKFSKGDIKKLNKMYRCPARPG